MTKQNIYELIFYYHSSTFVLSATTRKAPCISRAESLARDSARNAREKRSELCFSRVALAREKRFGAREALTLAREKRREENARRRISSLLSRSLLFSSLAFSSLLFSSLLFSSLAFSSLLFSRASATLAKREMQEIRRKRTPVSKAHTRCKLRERTLAPNLSR